MYKYLFIISFLFLSFSCNNLIEEIVQKHQNGQAAVVNYYSVDDSTKSIKRQVKYYSNGNIEVEGSFENENRTGHWVYYFEDGKKWSEGNFKNGLSHGKFTIWLKDGTIYYKSEYKEGKPHGKWIFYNDGKATKEVEYEKGEVVKEKILK